MADWRIEHGDCRELLASVPDGSVQCVVTSPPYWGLRDYGTATWNGGDPICVHRVPATGSTVNKGNNNREGYPFRGVCGVCGAMRTDSQIGLETTPDAYVALLVVLFGEVRRVLTDDGVVFLNLGDSYAVRQGATSGRQGKTGQRADRTFTAEMLAKNVPSGLKPKDLIGIPWAVAFALRTDGWYLRSDIIWSKPNPMPESVTDRPTKAHEYVFLLTKNAMYYYNADAIKEPYASTTFDRQAYSFTGSRRDADWNGHVLGRKDNHHQGILPTTGAQTLHPDGRNKRTVWTIATQPYKGAHFATMPEQLAETCILAGSRPGDLVLDPFSGAGTTGLVALRLQRRFLGFDLNAEYCALARRRIEDSAPLFLRETPA